MYDINLLILKGKYYIAKQKYLQKNIIFKSFLNGIKYDLNVEKYICTKNNTMPVFTKKYGVLYDILCNEWTYFYMLCYYQSKIE